MIRRRHDSGMTLTELMVVIVIIGILAASTRPLFKSDRVAREGAEFGGEVAREFQRARFQSIAERLPIRAFVFSDRVELRSAVAATALSGAPRAATISDPILRVIPARPGVAVWDITTNATAPSSQVLTTATYKTIEWSSLGQATLVGSSATLISVYVRNAQAGVAATANSFRIDVAPLSGMTQLAEAW